MKFIADAMLGRLARWLRLLGFDILYYPDISDSNLLKIARQQERFILTRDTHFLKMKVGDCLFINSDDVFEQLTEVIKSLKLKMPDTRRCANCNGTLVSEEKEAVSDSVPEHIYRNHNLFLRCTECGRVYWEGTHYRNFMQRLSPL